MWNEIWNNETKNYPSTLHSWSGPNWEKQKHVRKRKQRHDIIPLLRDGSYLLSGRFLISDFVRFHLIHLIHFDKRTRYHIFTLPFSSVWLSVFLGYMRNQKLSEMCDFVVIFPHLCHSPTGRTMNLFISVFWENFPPPLNHIWRQTNYLTREINRIRNSKFHITNETHRSSVRGAKNVEVFSVFFLFIGTGKFIHISHVFDFLVIAFNFQYTSRVRVDANEQQRERNGKKSV